MPTITVEGPPAPDLEKRRQLIKQVTAATVAYYGRFRPEDIVVIVREYPPECVGVGGELICDRTGPKK